MLVSFVVVYSFFFLNSFRSFLSLSIFLLLCVQTIQFGHKAISAFCDYFSSRHVSSHGNNNAEKKTV